MTDLIKRDDALECFMGFDRMGDVKDAIADLPAIDPAAIREEALREAAASIQWHITNLKHQNRGLALDLAVYGRDVVLAMIGNPK